MKFNYHTHTMRCHHAIGTDREYVEAAIRAGLTELGFSDHVPSWFPGDYYSGFRMERERLADYIASISALRAEYADRIRILIGFEAEYYPDCFAKTMELLAPYSYDYLILGQHFLGNENGESASVSPTTEEATLARYVDQVCAGMETGRFSYVAHPDVLNYQGDPHVYALHMKKLCISAKRCQIPLEINFLGLREHRAYPRGDFFQIAGECGCQVIFGCDVHNPRSIVVDPETMETAEEWCRRFGLQPVAQLTLRDPRHARCLDDERL